MKIIKLLVLAFALSAAMTNFAYSQNNAADQTTENLKTVSANVKGVTCSKDLKTISANVEKVNGVNSCKTAKQGATTTFKIEYDPSLVTEKEIFAAIENTEGCQNPDDRPYKVKQ